MCCPQVPLSDQLTTFSLRASDGAIRWTTDSHAAAIAADLGSAAGHYDLSGSVGDETYILSAGVPPLWRRLSSGATQADIQTDAGYPNWSGGMHRVLSDGSVITCEPGEDTAAQSAACNSSRVGDWTRVRPKFTVRRIDPDGAIVWTQTLAVETGSVSVSQMVYWAEIDADGWSWLLTCDEGPGGRWVADVDCPAVSLDWQHFYSSSGSSRIQRIGYVDPDGNASNEAPASANRSSSGAHPYEWSRVDGSGAFSIGSGKNPWANATDGTLNAAYRDNSSEPGTGYFPFSGVVYGDPVVSYRKTPGLLSQCASGPQAIPLNDEIVSGGRFTVTGPSGQGGMRRWSLADDNIWTIHDGAAPFTTSPGTRFDLHSGMTCVAGHGNDVYGLCYSTLAVSSNMTFGIVRAAADTGGSVAIMQGAEIENAYLAKGSIAWDDGFAFLYNRYPIDCPDIKKENGSAPFAALVRYRYTRDTKASGIYVCDRDLTTLTFVPLPYISYTVLTVCEDGDSRYLVVGNGNHLVGIDVTDPTAPVVVWRRSSMLLRIMSVQSDGANVTFGVYRVPYRSLGSLSTTIPDWSDTSLGPNSARLGWENYSDHPNGVPEDYYREGYRIVDDNLDSGYTVEFPSYYRGDFIDMKGVPV